MSTETALVVLPEDMSIADVFKPAFTDSILAQVRELVADHEPDLSTAKGRKEIASLAFQVAKSKTYLDGLGKDLVAAEKARLKAIDEERKKLRDGLDAIRDEVRQPLTEYEEAEAARVATLQGKVEELKQLADIPLEYSSAQLAERIERLGAIVVTEEYFEEYLGVATTAYTEALTTLTGAYEAALKVEADAEELRQLREAQAKREQEEREQRIREEAKAEAEERAKKAIEDEKARADKAIADEKERLAREAREKAEKEAEAERLERQRREDVEHRDVVFTEAMAALVDVVGITAEVARQVVSAIDDGAIVHLKLEY